MASFSGMGKGLEEGLGCNRDTHSLPLAESSLTSLPPQKLRSRTSLEGQTGVGVPLPLQEGTKQGGSNPRTTSLAGMGTVLVCTPCWGRSRAAPAGSHPEQLHVPAAQQDVENIKEGNKIKQKEASPPPRLPPVTPKTALGNTRRWAPSG